MDDLIAYDAITGTYYLRVYGYPIGNGSYNSTTAYALASAVATGPVSILTHPQNRTVPVGSKASFNVTVSGAAPVTYQWQRNSVDIPGATGSKGTATASTP